MHVTARAAQIGDDLLVREEILELAHGLGGIGFIVVDGELQRDLLVELFDIHPAGVIDRLHGIFVSGFTCVPNERICL